MSRVAMPLLAALAALLVCACTGTTTLRNGVETANRQQPTAAAQEAAKRAEVHERAMAHVALAAAYYDRTLYAIVLEEINEALQVEPGNVPAWSLRGLTYMALREDRDAEDSFRQGLRLAPNDPEIGNNYAYFLCDRGRPEEGLSRLGPVLQDPLYRTPEKALYNAAQCARRRNDMPAALAYLRRAVKLAPTDGPSATALAELLEQDKHPGEAREVLRPLLRALPPPKATLETMIRLDQALADPVQAAEHRAMLQKFHTEQKDGTVPPADPKSHE